MNAAGNDSHPVQHLIELGYEDPRDVAERRLARERERDGQRRAALALFERGQTAEGIAALERLAAAEPDWPAPRQLLARACLAAGRLDDADAHLDWLTWHGVESAQLALLRGSIAFARRELDTALDQATYASRLDPDIAGAAALAGDVHYRRGDVGRADEAYRAELERHANNATALCGKAAVCLRVGDALGAVDLSLQALAQDFHVPAAHYRLGIALARLGRVDEAITALETAAKLRPDFAAPFRPLSRLGAGDTARSEEYRRRGWERLRAKRRSAGASTRVASS